MSNLRRVLILEENTDHLELLTSLLETHFVPVDIHTVESIEDCLEFLEEVEYDLIMTGCFIHNVCITERLANIVSLARGAPIIVITGSGNEKIAAEIIKLGANEYVVKTKKALEEIPVLVEKYFKKGKKTAHKKPKFEDTGLADRLLREVDKLTQKARDINPKEKNLESLFSQINRLREMASKLIQK